MPGGRSGMAAGYYNGKIYLAGGLDGATYKNSTATWAYDPVTDSWDTTLMNMPAGVNTPGFAIINGHLHVAAGLDSDFDPVNTLYAYDIAGNTWATLPPIPIALHAPGSGALGGKLWIFGGGTPDASGRTEANSNVNAKAQAHSPSALNSTYIYDPAANIWTAGPNLNVARAYIAGSVVGNTVVAAGGVDTSMSAIYDTTETNTLASQCVTVTATSTPIVTGTAFGTNTAVSSATHTTLPTITGTAGEATETPPPATSIPTNTPTPCAITFTDVPSNHTFYAYIQCLACRGIISGYFDGTFRPNNDITRGQIAKVVSNAAGFNEDPGPQVYEDVPPNNTFYAFINRLSMRGVMGGYPCGIVSTEPCGTTSRPYFRPNANSTRGQLAKIVASAKAITGSPTGQRYEDVEPDSTFYVWIEQLSSLGVMGGYPCGTIPGEPCGTSGKPYFRPNNNVTRGQASKIVANTFYPACPMP
ncbi:MAG TPA: S-layer homology domain-containing protein [Chloroflexia bacterium]|nr:S-layer homology domain-containing protein [Chloroflexia bacterium]